jgi:small subunit ribosomal protein S1
MTQWLNHPMAQSKKNDPYREKFRPDADGALDAQIDAALAGLPEDLLNGSTAQTAAGPKSVGGAMRKGRIVSIDKDDVLVDLGGKDQGVASLAQFEEEPVVGQEVEFQVQGFEERDGLLILARKGAAAERVNWETLEIGQVVEGMVTGVNKGGLELDIKGMRAFMPAGQVEIFHVPDLSQFLNQKLTAEVMQFDRHARNIVLSRRNLLEQQREEAKKKLLEDLDVNQIRRGVVRNVLDFGAFVDLGGVEGLLHVSEMSFRRVKNAAELVKAGDVLDVKIIRFDRETGKLSLSLKQARGVDPWQDAGAKYSVGTRLTGRVTKLETFGAFIEVEEGIEGLLPLSEISHRRIKYPAEVMKEGDTLALVVISSDPAARRLAFSLKQAGPDPWANIQERYATDMLVSGVISRIAEFGAFVELEPGLEGLIHISELTDRRVRSAGDVVKAGQSVQVRVLETDGENRRMSLSLKRAAAAIPAAPTTAADSSPPPLEKKKKRPELRGGLDHKNFVM